MQEPIVVAITGASGTCYSLRLIQQLLAANHIVYVIVSKAAYEVARIELNLIWPVLPTELAVYFQEEYQVSAQQLQVFAIDDWLAPPASGTANIKAMVICPCSGGALSAVATGASNNLIERAADVMIKEQRKLIIVPRETPLSAIHLENMLKLAKLGVCILPAMPGFYQAPKTIDDLVDFVVARILNQLNVTQHLLPQWGA